MLKMYFFNKASREMRFQCLGKLCSAAMALRGGSQEPAYPSVVPLRSYSSLNLQQLTSCDFYL